MFISFHFTNPHDKIYIENVWKRCCVIKIVPAYKGILEYIKEAKSNTDADLKELWLKHAIDPYWDEWASGQFNDERTREQMQNPITELDKLSLAVEQLNDSGINSIIENTYRQLIVMLPPPETNKVICVYANPYLGENVGGVVGSCVGDNILIQINAVFPGWEAVVPWVLAHEYHHTVWGYNYFFEKGNTQVDLLTGLICDGQADSFAKSLNKSIDVSWINALSGPQEQEQWNMMQEYLNSTDDDIYCRFFFGDEKIKTPKYTAYTIGYHIVQGYLKVHSEISFIELLYKEAYEILAKSGYVGRMIGINSESYNHDIISELYDMFETNIDDIELIRSLIYKNKSLNILECFCGTGRILIPLAEDGHKITGIELSPNMVKRLVNKVNYLNYNISRNIEIRQDDVLKGNWGHGFDLIIMGANAFYELPSAESQERCIKLTSESLPKGGFIFIDNDDYKGDWGKSDFTNESVIFEGALTNGILGRYTRMNKSFDEDCNILCYSKKLYITDLNGNKKILEFSSQKHPVTAEEVKGWLRKYRFEIIYMYGERSGSPYTPESRRAIFWARKID